MRKSLLIALPLVLLLAACQRETGPDPLKLTGKMFVFNYRLAYATYLVTLEQTEPLPEGSVVKAEFENPAGGAPLTLERKIFPNLPRVVLESPDITCVKKGPPYKVTIAVIGPDGGSLQSLETQVTSSADQSILPAKALVVGPGYEKNPEVFKDGRAPEHFEMSTCPT
ncbi:hypothetical protein [Sinorhizobium sp. RAC02]|uniref:hypothetical protein n=1 Tax=Sinorhizobium sp. RAC02 TaxID=1842534 RepID=UPI00083D847C|nr:hypothetical protein [Sinorhizobium sp. RAC02]AOF92150.1 hypothetical protein BSY16_1677 [Sinorhizobium sp. RAC02]